MELVSVLSSHSSFPPAWGPIPTSQQTAIHHLLLFPFGNVHWNNTGQRGDDYSCFLYLGFADLSINPLWVCTSISLRIHSSVIGLWLPNDQRCPAYTLERFSQFKSSRARKEWLLAKILQFWQNLVFSFLSSAYNHSSWRKISNVTPPCDDLVGQAAAWCLMWIALAALTGEPWVLTAEDCPVPLPRTSIQSPGTQFPQEKENPQEGFTES